ncbi:MAG: TolC family protein [Tepidisphaeraceae bacterium]|jgi:outer membrane protein TolC
MMRKTLGLAVISITTAMLQGCGIGQPTAFDPQSIESIQKQSASENVLRELSQLPTSLPDLTRPVADPATTRPSMAAQPNRPIVRLKLQEIIHRAVANNLDTRVASYQSAIDETRILEAEARFDPTWVSSFQSQRQFPQGIIANNLTPPEVNSYIMSTGMKQDTDLGTHFEATAQTTEQRYAQQSSFSTALTRGKSWDDQVILKATQPLLRDFGGDVNRARITIARNDQKISQLDTRDQLEKVLQQIEEAYWKLVQAEQDAEIQEQLLKAAETTMDILIKRMVGDVNMVQVAQARSAVESRATDLVRARSRVEDYSDQIKRLMSDPEFPVAGGVVIKAADEPVAEPVKLALSDQIATALQNRIELLQQQIRIDSARIIIKAADNNALPKVDLSAQIGYEGIGLNWTDSLSSWDDSKLVNWGVGIQVEVPIGNRQARAIQQRTHLQYTQAVVQWKLHADTVANDVKMALREVETSWNESIAARRSVFAAQDALTAIEEREKGNQQLTPEFVQLKLDRQIAVASAKSSETRAIAGYNLALANLEKAKGTLLQYNAVELKEAIGPESLKYRKK